MNFTVNMMMFWAVSSLSSIIILREASADQTNWVEYLGAGSDQVTFGMNLSSTEVEIFYGSPTCIGNFTGRITDHGTFLSVVDPSGAAMAPNCEYTITPDGANAYRIEQGIGCTSYHGVACSLSGRVEKVEAFSPSFDCSSTLNEAEKVICEDVELSLLDRDLAEAYKYYIPTGHEIAPVPELMADWREVRDSCGQNKSCIELVYNSWIFYLGQGDIFSQLAPPTVRLDGQICLFQASQEDLDGPKIYSCYSGISELDVTSGDACQVGNNVYRLVENEGWFLERWGTVVEFLRGDFPSHVSEVSSLSLSFGRDHYETGCTLHSCISAGVTAPDGDHFASPRFYFWYSPDEWEPIVYPASTMFIVERDGNQYPDVQFCTYIKR